MISTSVVPLENITVRKYSLRFEHPGMDNGKGNRGTHNSNIILPPLHPHLQIMILINQSSQICQDLNRFLLAQLINLMHLFKHTIQALPPSNRVCTNDRMAGNKVCSHILRSTSRTRMNSKAQTLARCLERGIIMCCRQPFEEFLVRSREAIVSLIARCPKRVAAWGGHNTHLEDSIIGWDMFECHTIAFISTFLPHQRNHQQNEMRTNSECHPFFAFV